MLEIKNLHAKVEDSEILKGINLNVNNGERLETYVIEGERGKGDVIVNGPATYMIKKGDLIIINSYAQIDYESANKFKPKLLIFD